MSAIRDEFIVNLKGKSYPVWAGVLDLATRSGLKTLTTEVLQVPGADNDQVAIVRATATFSDDRVFAEIGDASPRNVAPHIKEALLRMAATRAKGRALRDACNIGQTMLEELPHEAEEPPEARTAKQGAPTSQPPPSDRDALIQRYGFARKRAKDLGLAVTPLKADMSDTQIGALLATLLARIAEAEKQSLGGNGGADAPKPAQMQGA